MRILKDFIRLVCGLPEDREVTPNGDRIYPPGFDLYCAYADIGFMKNKDAYIELLEVAKERLNKGKGCSYEDFKKEVDGKKGLMHVEGLFKSIYGDPVSSNLRGEKGMNIDSYFRLLEYEELQIARQDSLQARKEAKTAIWIAIILGGLQLILGLIQILN